MNSNSKKSAAYKAIDENLCNNMKIGIGSGSTVVFAVERIAQIAKEKNWTIYCVPTSYQSKLLIIQSGLLLCELNQFQQLDITFDGADEFDTHGCLLKGGGGAHTTEKIVAQSSKKLVILVDSSKRSLFLGQNWNKGIPVEVLPVAFEYTSRRICDLLSGNPILRMAKEKAGPVITDLGNFVLDVSFKTMPENLHELDSQLKLITGVIETGLFLNMNPVIYIGYENGQVDIFIPDRTQ